MKKNDWTGLSWRINLIKALRIMKLTIFLFVFCIIQAFAVTGFSQKTQLTLDVKNSTIENILLQIERQSNYVFLYNRNIVEVNKRTDISVDKASIEDILEKLFADTNVKYQIVNRQIVLSPEFTVQSQTVTGQVTDPSGSPLPGVTVVVKGTTQGTVTDFDGYYSLSNVPDNTILVFSFVGMKTQEVTVGNRNTVNAVMDEETIGLEEIVAVGYGVQRKATLTGSVGSIKSEELVQRPAANTTELLQGQIAGLVTRQSSGLPGDDAATLNIRGFGDPLVLIDGVESDLDQIDPNDIESISVLKDASAAVYGARAGNGVILVNTKRGKDRASQINYHGSVSLTQPTFMADLVNAREWAELAYEAGMDPDGYSPNHVHYDPETKRLINLVDNSDYAGYDWQEALFRDWTPQQQHNLNARGGSEKIKYFISAGYTGQESNFKSGDYDFSRYNVRSNIDANITEDLAISVDFSYRRTLLDKANFTVGDVFTSINRSKPSYPYIFEQDPERATYPGTFNSPYFQTFKDYSGFVENKENVVQGALEVRYSFPTIKGLVAKARLNYEDLYSWDKTAAKPFEIYEYDGLAAKNGEDPWILAGVVNPTSRLTVYSDRSTELLPLVSLEYENTFNDHHVKGMVVGEIRKYEWTSLRGTRKDVLSFEAPYLNFASDEGKDNSENKNADNSTPEFVETARASFIGRFNYDYKGKYILELAMRADASAEYPSEGRWGFFPSVSAGWRLSEEPFIKDNYSAVNNLKLRASHGVLGYDAISHFDYLTGFEITGQSYIFGTTPAPVINSAGLSNPDITWEQMKISNIGIDGTLWNGKLGFEIDAFYRLRENILTTPTTQVPSTFGATLPQVNLNKRDNRGIEITLSHMNTVGEFTYDVSPSFSWTRGKYKEWDEDSTPPSNLTTEEDIELWKKRNLKEGQWDDLIWGYVSDGFFMNQEEIDNYTIDQDQNDNQSIKVGDIKYKDLNGDNYIDWRDETVIGTGSTTQGGSTKAERDANREASLPNIMYSLNMGVSFKGLSFRMLWQGAADYAVTIKTEAAAPFNNESIPIDAHYNNRAILGTDGNNNQYITNPDDFKLPPVTQVGLNDNNSKQSDFWTHDARFLRLKNLYISYTLPKKLLMGSGINQCQFYMSGTNLWTISNLGIWKKSFDPEIISQENRSYPPVKTVTFGVKLTI